EGLYIAASARWPGCSKQYRCIPASGPYRKRPSAPSIPFLCIGQRDLGINRPGWDFSMTTSPDADVGS
ncbi:hypothetical protein BDW68DRAFT_171586, partial [Aspergillus falconensis]